MSKWTIFMRQTPFVTLLFLTLALATLPGCLRGKYQTRVRYDRATDSFETLVVFEDLWGEKDVDREHLVKTWKMRDDLMILPIPGFPWGGPYTLLRKDDGTLYGVSLHDGGTDPIFLTRADLPLSQVKISPGRLIVSDEGRLGYWQSLSCSGKFLDAAIARIIQRSTPEILEALELEIKRRMKPRIPVEEEAVGPNNGEDNSGDNGAAADSNGPFSPLDDLSLVRLQLQFKNEQIAVRRDGGVFSLTVQVSPDDAKRIHAEYLKVKAAAEKKPDGKPEAVHVFQPYLERIGVRIDPTGWVRITLDLSRPVACSGIKDDKKGADSAYREMLDYVIDQGVDVDRTFDPQKLLDAFTGTRPPAAVDPEITPLEN